uniref:Glucan endo-1,3-beta-D-glucosidase n=1 Tax=Aureoumbra lagunensis TaxID=44058 RepID=A0A7S3JZY5_9STRA|mmetsp:Transcript_2940/g.4592  ORF Transcript_2940/g.4592 Transcript_2940/m.4592 type:complete len:688 (+) Transcript_2940:52-2115(+)
MVSREKPSTMVGMSHERQRKRRRGKYEENGNEEILENVGVIVRPESEVGPAPGRSIALRRLRSEGVARARLLEYTGESIEKVATGLGYVNSSKKSFPQNKMPPPKPPKLVVSIPDDEVLAFGSDYEKSVNFARIVAPWIRREVVELILVGVTPPSGVGADVRWMSALATATKNVAKACAEYNASAPVSTSFSLSVLRSSFPPSASLFAAPGPLAPILNHLRESKAPFVIELDPYLAWRQSYYDISLDYALFGPQYGDQDNQANFSPEFIDGTVEYWNLFDAMLDAVRWALFREGYQDLDVLVGSVGWPSGYSILQPHIDGGTLIKAPPAASTSYAAKFNSRLARHLNCTRSPIPGAAIDIRGCARLLAYIFEADNVLPIKQDADTDTKQTTNNQGQLESQVDTDQHTTIQLQWGIADAITGRLKYSLRSGQVLTLNAPLHRVPSPSTCTSPNCIFRKMFSPATPIALAVLAALLFGAIILLMSLLATLLKLCCTPHRSFDKPSTTQRERADYETDSSMRDGDYTATQFIGGQNDPLSDLPEDNTLLLSSTNGSGGNGQISESWTSTNIRPLFNFLLGPPRKKPTFSRHTADSVASIIRTTRHTAAENLRDDRRTRGFRSAFGRGGFENTTNRSSYLRAIAESPIQSETDDDSSTLHERKPRTNSRPIPVSSSIDQEPRSPVAELSSI